MSAGDNVETIKSGYEAFGRGDVRFAVTVRATGKQVAMNLHHYWRSRDGKIEYYRGSEDTAQTLAALHA